MKINPVYLKDLKLNVRNCRFAILVFVYTLCLGLITILFLYAEMYRQDGIFVFNYEVCNELLALISGIELGITFFIVPALTCGVIASEREKQTLDLLLVSKLSPFHIICGKMSYAFTVVILIILSSFPMISMVLVTGWLSMKVIGQLCLLILVTSIYVASIGIYFSVIKKKVITAAISSYCTIFVITLGTILLYNLNQFILEANHFPNAVLSNASYYILLINPITTYIYIISDTSQSIMADWIPIYMQGNWVELSIFVQLASSVCYIKLASDRLNPLSKQFLKKVRKQQ